MAEELKPCPFCGGAASMDEDTPYTGTISIGCTICYATTYVPLGSRSTLIDTWNGRKPAIDQVESVIDEAITDIKSGNPAMALDRLRVFHRAMFPELYI